MSSTFSITVNGTLYSINVTNDPKLNPYTTLADFLRAYTPHKDTKVACGEGGCGACTVALTFTDAATGTSVTRPINACLALLFSLDGLSVTTSQGIGNGQMGYHPIQKALAENSGTQCGYCSSGMTMFLYAYLQQNPTPSAVELEKILDGNLCRCTGYRPILETYRAFAANGTKAPHSHHDHDHDDHHHGDGACLADKCCRKRGLQVEIEDMASLVAPQPPLTKPSGKQCHVKAGLTLKTATNAAGTLIWHDITTLTHLAYYMNHYSGMKMMLTVGATSLGVYRNYNYDVFLHIAGIPELNTMTSAAAGLSIGAAVSVHDVINYLTSVTAPTASYQTAHFSQAARHLKRLAGYAIRCRASIGGNLCLTHHHQSANDFFPSDACIVLMGLGATVSLLDVTTNTTQTLTMTQFFATSITNQVLVNINIPWGKQNEVFMTYKIAIRQVMDHALVNAAMRVTVNTDTSGNTTIGSDNTIAIGGVMSTPTRVTTVESALAGVNVSDVSTLQTVATTLQTLLTSSVAPFGGRQAYRVQTACNFFYKFFLYLQANPVASLARAEQEWMTRPLTQASQTFGAPKDAERPVSEAIPKIDGLSQTSGEAMYTDDIPDPQGVVYCALVQTHQSNATFAVTPSVINDVIGFVKYYDAANFKGQNQFGMFGYAGPLFAATTTQFSGQAIGLVVAKTELIARMCAAMVESTITYSNIGTPVVTVTEALAQPNPYFMPDFTYTRPGSDTSANKFKSCAKSWSGVKHIGPQFHFHMERHAVLVTPVESQFVVDVASQCVPGVQAAIATCLSIPRSDITVRTRRCGGAFGAKSTAPTYTSSLAAYAAKDLGLPVRFNMTFSQPFQMLGARPSYQMNYTIGTNTKNEIEAVKLELILLVGIEPIDETFEAKKACHNIDNCYNIKNFTCTAKMVKGNLPAATSMRGPGWIQSITLMEMLVEEAALVMGVDSRAVRRSLFYKDGDTTLGGMPLRQVTIGRMFDQLLIQCNYDDRLANVATFNASNKFVKRGLACMASRFSVGWGTNFNSTVAVYPSDGTVCVTHGGIEVGQGINTKVAQAVAYKFGMTSAEMLKKIRLLPCSTQVVSGSSNNTGGSITSELCVMSVMHACDDILARIEPYRSPDMTFTEVCVAADEAGINLTASGVTGTSAMYRHDRYNSWGVATAEVEVDALTGQFEVKRADLIFDCGISMNPDIDIGQVEGGFVMGLGWFTQEIGTYDPATGSMLEPGSWEYKPPSSYDIPEILNVTLLENSENSVGVLSSKAVGEPPVALAGAVAFAIQNAVNAARSGNGISTALALTNLPVSVDKIAALCGTAISNYVLS